MKGKEKKNCEFNDSDLKGKYLSDKKSKTDVLMTKKFHDRQDRSSCARDRPTKSDSEDALFRLKCPLILDIVIHSKQILPQDALC